MKTLSIHNGNSPQLGIRMPREMKSQLGALAAAARRKTSDYVRTVLEDHIKEMLGKTNFGPLLKSAHAELTAVESTDANRSRKKSTVR